MNVYSSKRLHQFVNAERWTFAVSGRGYARTCTLGYLLSLLIHGCPRFVEVVEVVAFDELSALAQPDSSDHSSPQHSYSHELHSHWHTHGHQPHRVDNA